MATKKDGGSILSHNQKKYLRGLGHHLTPVVYIGKEGLAEAVIEATIAALDSHELIKVKINNNSSVHKNEAAETLPADTGSSLVQLIGKTLLLYKPNKKKKKDDRIKLP